MALKIVTCINIEYETRKVMKNYLQNIPMLKKHRALQEL